MGRGRTAALALLLAACSGPTRPGAAPDAGGSGGEGACTTDADGDGYLSPACGGDDCNDADPAVHPGAAEACGGADLNCDGFVLPCCAPGTTRACFPPGLDAASRGVGSCRDGVETCKADGSGFGLCEGAVEPGPERCGDRIDSDCNGYGGPGEVEDVGCCVPAGEETCNGLDDDCDGLVDEGVVNACGLCGEATCYTEDFHNPASCADADRNCSHIVPDEYDPDAITLSGNYWGGGDNDAYFAVPARLAVVKIDTITGQKLWEVGTGDEPTSLAIPPPDSSVWVLNRGLAGAAGASVLHLDREGNVICRVSLPGSVGGLAIDSTTEQVWTGRIDAPELRVFDGNATDGVGADRMPICASARDVVKVSEPVVGLAFDDRGIAWTTSFTNRSVRLDTSTMTEDVIEHSGPTLGVALGRSGEAWFAGSPVHSISADGPYTLAAIYEKDEPADAAALAISHDDLVYAAGSSLLRIDPANSWALPKGWENAGSAVAEDDSGKIWLPLDDGRAARFDPVTEEFQSFDVDPGHALTAAVSGGSWHSPVKRGTWSQVVDSGYATTIWTTFSWQELRPPGSFISARLFFASSRDGLATAPACSFQASPADLTSCPRSHGARFAVMEIDLRNALSGARPVAGHFSLSYTRP